jgi:uncharacterized RDD family membrane protein YckC
MPSTSALQPPAPLKARLLCMVYESMLLFGVMFIGAWLFSTLMQQRHALNMRNELQVWLFIVLGFYFTWFWTHGGQTLAMKTWHIKLLNKEGTKLSWHQAVLRYLLAWLWFLPGLALARLLDAQGWMLILLPTLNFIICALAVFLHPERQFLHDRMAKTKIVLVPARQKSVAANKN